MSGSPYAPGDFVWCAYPQREQPARPGPLHIGFVLGVSGAAAPLRQPPAFAIMAAYTTSRTWPDDQRLPLGVFPVGAKQAATMGQHRAFTIDARRLALMPLTVAWFPWLARPNVGKVGAAPSSLLRQVMDAATELAKRGPENLERLGPIWSH